MVNKLTEKGISATWLRNDQMHNAPRYTDILVRWGCTATYPRDRRNQLINKAREMHLVYDKKGSRELLQNEGASVPKSYFSVGQVLSEGAVGRPLIARPRHHSQGRDTTVLETLEEIESFRNQDYYFSEYIQKEKEFRVHIMYNYVLAVTEKVPEDRNAICWNEATAGSAFNNVKWNRWPLELLREAFKVSKILNIDFGGIDFMQKGDRFYCLECNSAPSLSPYRQEVYSRGLKYILNYLEEEGRLPPKKMELERLNNYTDIIHPGNQ
jgi:glutathione synthase/RimK-type ligase-like ATP-grasp enzyme